MKIPATVDAAHALRGALAGVGTLDGAREIRDQLADVAEECRNRADAAMSAALGGAGDVSGAVTAGQIADAADDSLGRVRAAVAETEQRQARDRLKVAGIAT